jgi:hypothetical protein
VLLAIEMPKVHQRSDLRMRVSRPHNALASPMWFRDLTRGYRKVQPEQAQPHWEAWYTFLERANFPKRSYGMRKSDLYMIVGALLPVWKHLKMIFDRAPAPTGKAKKRPMRVGRMFPECSVNVPCMFPECSLNIP